MKTAEQWFQDLPDGYRERAIANIDPEQSEINYPSLADSLHSSFEWINTPEKGKFWVNLYYYALKVRDLPPLPESDKINHPQHYGGGENPYEAIKVIEAWGLNFHLGNVVKYVARAGKKGDAKEDLLKAQWYLNREIERLK